MRTIGPFEILEPLVRGGSAVVHAARWSDPSAADPRELVAKVALDGRELVLHNENAALRAVEHSNVVAPVAFVDDSVRVALVLPRAVCSLAAHAGRLDATQVAPTVAALASGLAELHRCGWAHGDVRASNVLLLADGTALLGDLGDAASITTVGAAADVTGLCRAAIESLTPTPRGALADLLEAVIAEPCSARALADRVDALAIEPRHIDVHAAPPLVVEPPTVVVEPSR